MKKEFIPYEQALALKELGFDEPCIAFYEPNNEKVMIVGVPQKYNDPSLLYVTDFCAPLYQQAFRWFREKDNLEYQIIKSVNGNYSAVIHLNTQEYLDKISTLPHACLDEVVDCYSYEESELECLKKLIEIVKNK